MGELWLALDPEQEPRGIGTSAAAAWRFACPAEWASDLERWPTVAEGLGWKFFRVVDAAAVAVNPPPACAPSCRGCASGNPQEQKCHADQFLSEEQFTEAHRFLDAEASKGGKA